MLLAETDFRKKFLRLGWPPQILSFCSFVSIQTVWYWASSLGHYKSFEPSFSSLRLTVRVLWCFEKRNFSKKLTLFGENTKYGSTNFDFFRTSSNHIKSTFGRRELVEGLNESYWPKEEAQYQTVWIETKLQKLKICGGHPRRRKFFFENLSRPIAFIFS